MGQSCKCSPFATKQAVVERRKAGRQESKNVGTQERGNAGKRERRSVIMQSSNARIRELKTGFFNRSHYSLVYTLIEHKNIFIKVFETKWKFVELRDAGGYFNRERHIKKKNPYFSTVGCELRS